LKQYDPLTWFYLRDLWDEIARWKDPEGSQCCRRALTFFGWCQRVKDPDRAVVSLREDSIDSDGAEYNLLLGDDSASSLEFPDSVSL